MEQKEIEVELENASVDSYNDTLKSWVISNKDLTEEIQKELVELLTSKGYLG